MFEFLNITKALAEENRLRILLALEHQELCVCQLIELLKLAPSTVSKHVSILRQARLVTGRKDGRWIFYQLAGDGSPVEVKEAIDCAISLFLRDRMVHQNFLCSN